jgi:hypothetical protein
MAVWHRGFYGYSEGLRGRFRIEATTTAGEFLIRNAAANTAGEVEKPTTTAAAHLVGVSTDVVAYSATQAAFDGFPGYRQSGEEGTVGLLYDPFSVWAIRVAGSATPGGALVNTTPGNLLVNTVADTTGLVVSDVAVGTIDMSGGLIMGKTGNNVGVVKRLTTHNNGADCRVIEPFPHTIAVGDEFIRVPFSKSAIAVQLTTPVFSEANGIIAYGTGCAFNVIDVDFDLLDEEVLIHAVSGNHFLNPIA